MFTSNDKVQYSTIMSIWVQEPFFHGSNQGYISQLHTGADPDCRKWLEQVTQLSD